MKLQVSFLPITHARTHLLIYIYIYILISGHVSKHLDSFEHQLEYLYISRHKISILP